MDQEKLVEATSTRVVATVSAAVCIAFVIASQQLGASTWLIAAAILSGLVAALGLIFSFKSIYTAWMRFAAVLQSLITTILFGACYLLIVPIFTIFTRITDPLGLRPTKPDDNTYWIKRHNVDANNPSSYQRMG